MGLVRAFLFDPSLVDNCPDETKKRDTEYCSLIYNKQRERRAGEECPQQFFMGVREAGSDGCICVLFRGENCTCARRTQCVLKGELENELPIFTPTKDATSLKTMIVGRNRMRESLAMFLRFLGSASTRSSLVRRKRKKV